MNEFNIQHLSREHLKQLMNFLAEEGIDYSYNPHLKPETIIFDLTELDRIGQKKVMLYLKSRITERYLRNLIQRIIREQRQKLKESSFNDEIEELAIDLIDYLGTELPTINWQRNPRIANWFRSNTIQVNSKIAREIYEKALKLNADNKPKSRRYLDN